MASRMEVLFEDNHLIAVWKPAGVPTQGDATGLVSLLDETKRWLKEKHQKPGEVFLGLLQRLDRPVCGVVLFAKTSKGASRLSEQIRTRAVEKEYRAIVEGVPAPAAGTLTHYLGDSEGMKRVAIAKAAGPGLKLSVLHYETLESKDGFSLLRVRLETGRKHQIRAQLGFVGHAVRGDHRYGAGEDGGDEIALVAWRFRFQHPVRREETVEVGVPERLSPIDRWW